MAQYKIGTATFTNGSATVTGTGTAWTSNLVAGNWITRKATDGTTYETYIIGGIVSDTELTLTAPYGGTTATDVDYVGHIDFGAEGQPVWANGDIEFASIQNEWNAKLPSFKTSVSNIGSISQLPPATGSGRKVSVTGYHAGTTVGGDPMVDAGLARHDGVIYFDPDRVAEIGTSAYYVDSGSDANCWERAGVDSLTIEMAGGDVSIDNSIVFDAIQDIEFIFKGGNYQTSGTHTFTNAVFFEKGSSIEVTAGVVTFSGTVNAVEYPFRKSGAGRVDAVAVDLNVPADFASIQAAIDAIPTYQWQRFNVNIANGAYDEEVFINNKWAAAATTGNVVGERTGVYIVGETKAGVQVKAYMVTSCGGASFTPMIAQQTITGHNTKTNEEASIEFYGCPSGAVLDVDFASTLSSDKALMSYGSIVSAESVSFGDQLYTDLFVTKHGGRIMSNSNTRQNSGVSPTGKAIRYVSNPIGGDIFFLDMSGLTSAGFDRVRQGGLMAGFTYDAGGRVFYGPRNMANQVAAYQSYLTSLDDFTYVESGAASTVTIDPDKGLKLHCGSVAGAYSHALIRRTNTISSQTITFQQQLLAAIHFPAMTGAFFQIGIGAANSRIYIEVNQTDVLGVFIDSAGALTSVNICSTADIANDNCVFDIFVERDNTTASTQNANVRFKISTRTFETYKEIKAISGAAINTFEWYAKIESTAGTEQDVYLGEIRLYRE